MPDYFSGGILNEITGWHGKGDVWDREANGPLYPRIAMKHKSMDWLVEKRPVWTINRDGDLFVVDGQFEIVRKLDDMVLSDKTVGKQYTEIQNEDGFNYLDSLIDAGELEIETAIALFDGKIVNILARKPEGINIAGDSHDRFIGFTLNHRGNGANKVYTCYERVVCSNTMNIAVGEYKKSGRNWSIRHQGDITEKLSAAREALELSYEQDDALSKELEALASEDMTNDSYTEIMNELVGINDIDPVKQEKKFENASELRTRIHTIRRERDDLQNLPKKSKLRLLNAVTAYETHERKFRTDGTRFQKLAVEGGELTNRAYSLLTA